MVHYLLSFTAFLPEKKKKSYISLNRTGHNISCTSQHTICIATSSKLTSVGEFVVEDRHNANTDPHLLVGLSIVRS